MNLSDILGESIREFQRLSAKSLQNDEDYFPSAEINQIEARPDLKYDQTKAIEARVIEFYAFIIHCAEKNLTIHLEKILTMIHYIQNEVKMNSTLARALQSTMEDLLHLYYKPSGLMVRVAIQMTMAILHHIRIPSCWQYLVDETTTKLYDTKMYNYRIALKGPPIPNAIEHMFL